MARSKNKGTLNARYIPRGDGGQKLCSRCRQMREIASFKIDRSRFDGRGYICAECRDANRIKAGPTIRIRRQQRKLGLAWCDGCAYWMPTEEIHAGKCQPCANAYARRMYAQSPSFREKRRGRAIARRRGIDPIPAEARALILEEFDGRCAYCRAPATTWDHVVAFTKGGLTEPYNIVPACARCNSSKRTQNVWVWLEKTGREPHPQFTERLALYHINGARGPDPFE